jgi:N-acetylneuraminate lyase
MKLAGLVAAVHTPFADDGSLALGVVERQCEHLQRNEVRTVFIGGTTGECHSLTVEERLALAKRWLEVVKGSNVKVVVHVGSNCIADACTLAHQAQTLGATAVSAMAPSYFKPKSVDALIACCEEIAAAAPKLPFYFYDIPSMTGVQLSMPEFLPAAAKRIPNLAGLKFTNADMAAYQRCLHADEGKYDVSWGMDDSLLAALALGAVSAVGSTYNFAAPIYYRMLAAYTRGDVGAARREQLQSVRLVETLNRYDYMAAAKAVMTMLGVSVGQPRLPIEPLSETRRSKLRSELESLGFFEWIRR